MRKILVLACLLIVSACSTGRARGVVAMRIDDETAHVCVGKTEMKTGDRVELYRSDCSPSTRTGKPGTTKLGACTLNRIADGEITSTLNDHYAVVKLSRPSVYREGDIVEKVLR